MQRRAIAVRGLVQGVGFRPFVHALAARYALGGFVRNDAAGVHIEVEGPPPDLDSFLDALRREPPPLARIEEVQTAAASVRGEATFRIVPSRAGSGAAEVGADTATCAACLRELRDPHDRRYRHPFINCTDCGPRLTVVTGVPYDRERTTMAPFPMCAACRAEYEDPRSRRFHAQPIACADCGPRLRITDAAGRVADGDPLREAAAALRAGAVVAVKGLGGYHLACDATNPAAVATLRRRKHRDRKPLAVLVRDVEAAAAFATVSEEARRWLESGARPIVLLPKRRAAAGVLAEEVAPEAADWGVLLPYTPLHHLLATDVGRPLVLTSGNRTDEPIAVDDGEARARLAGIADLFLAHDRAIHVRAEDSVWRARDGGAVPVRRSRGFAPRPVGARLGLEQTVLAVGGHLKAVFALGEGDRAWLSPHLGDLDDAGAADGFARDVLHHERLFGLRPALLVHDLHPDYASTRYALARAAREGLPTLGVQHHHAHLASVLAENGTEAPATGVLLDGAGLGLDGTVWGGEFLVGDASRAVRAASLRPVALPGGDAAAREPWRSAFAHLLDAGEDPAGHPAIAAVPASHRSVLVTAIERGVNAPLASSAGRLFDAVAVIAGFRGPATYEGEAACWLEARAAEASDAGEPYPFALAAGDGRHVVDTRPIVQGALSDARGGRPAAAIARRFHLALAAAVAATCRALRGGGGPGTAALSGGCFVNRILATEVEARLEADGFRVLRHRQVPPNDGGLALGQLAVAAAHLRAAKGR